MKGKKTATKPKQSWFTVYPAVVQRDPFIEWHCGECGGVTKFTVTKIHVKSLQKVAGHTCEHCGKWSWFEKRVI